MAGNKSSTNTALVATLAASAATLVTTAIFHYWVQKRKIQELSHDWERKRQEERTGRIRAEQKLRIALQKQTQTAILDDPHAMNLSCIGEVVSPYTKRMGTPRQGALVPSSRGFIQFVNTLPPPALDGIDEYSHIWIIFQFHANTSLSTSKKTKVRPPRGGGIKVGQLATRSPHRPNVLGLSLVKMERWDASTRRLHISALDLVHGTPVYDIKPYVHWDLPGDLKDKSVLTVPFWVESENDVLQKVEFAPGVLETLESMIQQNRLAPLYPASDKTSMDGAQKTLLEILAQDPRSSHKGDKNARGSLSNEPYRLLFGGIEVEFIVDETGATVMGVVPSPVEKGGDDESS
jgi:tRNA-Thr(GGU) m(6)t(6)A37 methyltransferase TsaA